MGLNFEKVYNLIKNCINSKASKTDFKVLNALSQHKGIASKSQLMNSLYVENDVLEHWLQSCLNKHLIVKTDNTPVLFKRCQYFSHREMTAFAPRLEQQSNAQESPE